jgi:hypothetical protein
MLKEKVLVLLKQYDTPVFLRNGTVLYCTVLSAGYESRPALRVPRIRIKEGKNYPLKKKIMVVKKYSTVLYGTGTYGTEVLDVLF